jgi:hypothetical protein
MRSDLTGISHAVEAFLDAGYPVRGTVRSNNKGEYLKKLFEGKKAKFEYVIVMDISKVGSHSRGHGRSPRADAL